MFRIEDTDAARDSEESYRHLLDCLRWLGLDWDEGPEVGGPHGPYRQSRAARHLRATSPRKLLAAGHAYESFSTNEEVDARRLAAGQDPKLGYDNHDRDLTDEQKAAFRAEGREPVLRLRMPDEDLVLGRPGPRRGPLRRRARCPTSCSCAANGEPLYPFVNPVDDALMGITHVLRGEDLLPSTPRQLALYARARPTSASPRARRASGTCRYVMGEGNKKLSKRDPQSNLDVYRERGFLPEGLLNYLALLGWSIAEDRDIFSMAEMVEAFDVTRVSANPARFDLKKAEAINATHLRALPVEEFVGAGRARTSPRPGWSATRRRPSSDRVLEAIAPLVQERMIVLVRGRRAARLPVRRRRRDRRGRRGQAAAPEPTPRGARRGRRPRCAELRRLVDRRRSRRRCKAALVEGLGPQAAAGVRAGAGGGQRPHGLPAAVRVDRAARPGAHAGPPGGRPRARPSGRRAG